MVYSITEIFGRALNRSHLSLNCSSGKYLSVLCHMDQILSELLPGRVNSLAVHAVIPKTLHLVCSDPWICCKDSLGSPACIFWIYPEVCSPGVAGCKWTWLGALLAASVLLWGAGWNPELSVPQERSPWERGKQTHQLLLWWPEAGGYSRAGTEGGRQVVLRTLCLGKFPSLCPTILVR